MFLLIVFLPLFSFLCLIFLGSILRRIGSYVIALGSIYYATVLSWIAVYLTIWREKIYYIKVSNWLKICGLSIDWEFVFDRLAIIMCPTVLTVALVVHLYSVEYMRADPHFIRFFSYLSLFTFFMLILVTAANLVQLFVGWEGVGICSYLLINFWHSRIEANKAAIKALLVNKVGDFGLLIAILVSILVFHSSDFSTIFALAPYHQHTMLNIALCSYNIMDLLCLMLAIAAIGKSAQFGLHTWLPDAMEGPTPVSALIHAATMVTAGVFLIIRCSHLFEYSVAMLNFITIIGCATAIFAGTAGIVQHDIKKIIAYSTCSQLGYMVFACGLSAYDAALFHLTSHAFFKALLFLSAGSIIHAYHGEQDIRKMGASSYLLPLSYSSILIGSLALIGFPFLNGFYSKDAILELALCSPRNTNLIAFFVGIITAGLTIIYSTRLIYYVFITRANGYKRVTKWVHEPGRYISWSLVTLSAFSLFFSYAYRDLFVGGGSDYFQNSILFTPPTNQASEFEFLPIWLKLLPFILIIIITAITLFLLEYRSRELRFFKTHWLHYQIYHFLAQKWYFDGIYNHYIVNKTLKFCYDFSFRALEKGAFELFGPELLKSYSYMAAKQISIIQNGRITHYLFSLLLISSLVFLLAIINNY